MLQISSIQTTLTVFFNNPIGSFTLKDISKESKLAHTSTKQNLKNLISLGLIEQKIEKKGQRKFPVYKATRNKQFIKYKRIYNLTQLEESGIINYIEEKLLPKSIVIFGSYQRGEDVEESDIDLFVEAKKEYLNLQPFEKKLKRKIELHFNEKFTNYPAELKNNIINGIIIYGFLEVYK
ncbi:MAG: nucleotidyltransferase domain-containing protein [Nanoarchaeota archaeon]